MPLPKCEAASCAPTRLKTPEQAKRIVDAARADLASPATPGSRAPPSHDAGPPLPDGPANGAAKRRLLEPLMAAEGRTPAA